MRFTKSWDDILFQILVNGFLIAILVAVIIPLWRVLLMSVWPLNYIDTKTFGMWLAPWKWSAEAYKQLLRPPILHPSHPEQHHHHGRRHNDQSSADGAIRVCSLQP